LVSTAAGAQSFVPNTAASGEPKVIPFVPAKVGEPPTAETLSHVRQSDIGEMSFRELDSFIDAGVQRIALDEASIMRARKAMVPAIWKMHDALSRQGKRTDLLDAPEGLTFDGWIKSKENLGSRATFYRLLKDAGLTPQKQFSEGTRVKVKGKGEAGTITLAHEADGGVPKYDVLFGDAQESRDRSCGASCESVRPQDRRRRPDSRRGHGR
jgi:hypothetical protein